MKPMAAKNVTHILVHNSASKWGDVAEITRWHKERGFNTIGYHYVITNTHPRSSRVKDPAFDGVVHNGRALDKRGAHEEKYNHRSLGICLIGRGPKDFTVAQLDSLRKVCRELMGRFKIPRENVLGHAEVDPMKRDPGFDMDAFRASL